MLFCPNSIHNYCNHRYYTRSYYYNSTTYTRRFGTFPPDSWRIRYHTYHYYRRTSSTVASCSSACYHNYYHRNCSSCHRCSHSYRCRSCTVPDNTDRCNRTRMIRCCMNSMIDCCTYHFASYIDRIGTMHPMDSRTSMRTTFLLASVDHSHNHRQSCMRAHLRQIVITTKS